MAIDKAHADKALGTKDTETKEMPGPSAQEISGTAFSETQKEYLEGFFRGLKTAAITNPNLSAASKASTHGNASTSSEIADANSPDLPLGKKAQLAWLASGKRLSKEEKIKFDSDPLDFWPRIAELSAKDQLPEGEDLFRFKYHGLWNVSPVQNSMMCRLRIPGGVLKSYQAKAIADTADAYGNGFIDITTRANFQIREIAGRHMLPLLTDLHEAGIIPRGSGADNIRNVTGNPTCGIDPNELYDVLPLCRELHYHILHDRSLYGLPRKFNVAFDGGNNVSSLEDTNDIGLKAVRIEVESQTTTLENSDVTTSIEPGIYFRLALGGITGHGDLAKDTGLILKPEECLPVIVAMLKVYIQNGDRGNRKRSRLKYVLDAWGIPKFLEETQKLLPFTFKMLPESACTFAPQPEKAAHLGIHEQKQAGLKYIGIDIPVGKLTTDQLRGLAKIADQFGSSTLRLTVWQNLLISDIAEADIDPALQAIAKLDLTHEPDPIQAGLVACTGSEGCKFGMAPTKSTALAISKYLRGRIELDSAINIHLTGCNHSCAQHFIGDIGLIATSVETEVYKGAGFHFFLGGGFGRDGRMAIAGPKSIPLPDVPMEVERILNIYLQQRLSNETFTQFSGRVSSEALQNIFANESLSLKEPA